MTANDHTPPAIGTREEWRAARLALLEEEKAHMRRYDKLVRQRQRLPWVPVDKTYRFETTRGTRSLEELFDGRSQLLLYHFMFGPDWTRGCIGCSFLADHIDGAMPHVNARDITLVCTSRGPLERLQAYRQRMGWQFEWVSSLHSDYNADFDDPLGLAPDAVGETSTLNVFVRHDGTVYHTYTGVSRGLEVLDGAYHWIDHAPRGRDEDGLDYPQQWWRRHDEYGQPEAPTVMSSVTD
ncbi:DUF899 domain-containing protein [Aquisalimonas lutea]|uniref:DUF899 domain-containing protein n=1 Tax=Aquisalimonas lutea TaxID=1327750 RepID=UPI0025B2ADAE|nr:DUF899 domain-containing protein [Aquisalimonas lutea]MDN3519391.1 DUF899 domain-containing protein [Aquisalimonas lutea]